MTGRFSLLDRPRRTAVGSVVTARPRDLPLFWKLLVPFLVLLVALGTAGAFVLVRSLSNRAVQTIDADLAQRSLAARNAVHDRELYVLESASLAANLQGMADATQAHDRVTVERLLGSVLALKTDLTLVAITDATGRGIAEYSRSTAGAVPVEEAPAAWTGDPLVAPLMKEKADTTNGRLLGFGDRPLVAFATTMCAGTDGCERAGMAIVAVDAVAVVHQAQAGAQSGTGVSVYDARDRLVSSSGPVAATPIPTGDFVRRNSHVGGRELATLFSPLTLQGRRVGTLAVTMPTAPAFAGVRAAGTRIALVILLAMAGVVAIGALLSRLVLTQVRQLVATNRALESGDLTARVPVRGNDELGELARGVNNMAAALQESYETLEARVEQRTAEVQRLLEERTEFFTAVSHEFRTPLAVILGQAKILADPDFGKKAISHAQAADVLTEAASQLLGFVNDILDIAKLASGRATLDLVDVAVDEVVRNLKPTITALAKRNGLQLQLKICRRLPAVRAEESRLRQVVLNLVDNAVKYTPVGGRVAVSVGQEAGRVMVTVSDTGVGIPADSAERLFEPFYRVKGNETQGGQPSSGLGLALVKGLVDAMGGEITFESAVGKGTTFRLSLPVSINAARATVVSAVG